MRKHWAVEYMVGKEARYKVCKDYKAANRLMVILAKLGHIKVYTYQLGA